MSGNQASHIREWFRSMSSYAVTICVVLRLKCNKCIIYKVSFSHFYHAVVYTSRAAYQLIWPFHFLSHVMSHMYCDGISAAMSLVKKLKSFMDINEWIVHVANIWGQPSKISGFYRDMHDKLSEYKVNRSTTPTVDMSLYLVQSSRNMGYRYINPCEVICSTVIMSAVSTCKFGRMIFFIFVETGE